MLAQNNRYCYNNHKLKGINPNTNSKKGGRYANFIYGQIKRERTLHSNPR